MNILDFLENFSTTDIIICIVVIIVIVFLIILSNNLSKKNKELRDKLNNIDKNSNDVNSDLDTENNTNDKDIFVTTNINDNYDEDIDKKNIEVDNYDINEVKNDTMELFESIMNDNRFNSNIKTDSYLEKMDNDDEIIKDDINEILKDMPNVSDSKAYTKNVLRSISASGQTSPVNIGKSTVDAPKLRVSYTYANNDNNIDINDFSHDINDSINKDIESFNNNTNNYNEMEEISKKLEEELRPQTIELTDYEKKQEEEAIISYQELLEAKNKNNITEDDEDIDTLKFIDELKDFRTNLKGE